MRKITTLFIVGLLAGTANTASAKSPKLALSSPHTSNYQCNDGTKIKVAYYNLSDNSLSFAKFTLDGEAYTLPAVVSASGSRYTDLNKIEWFEKGGTASLNKEVTNEKSTPIECKEMKAAKK